MAPLTRAMVKYPELRPQGMMLDKGCAQRAKERNMTMGNLDEFNLDSIKKAKEELLQSLDMQADSLISFLNGYELYKKTGDPSLIPKFHSDIKDKHSKEQPA